MMIVLTVWLCILVVLIGQSVSVPNSTLKLVHIVLRHGNRYVLNEGKLRADNMDITKGELTEEGIRKSFILGQWIRHHYGSFLDLNARGTIEATSTSIDRTKDTLRAVLQGLYLDDDPREVIYVPLNSSLLMVPNQFCTNYVKYYEQYTKSKDYQELLDKYDFVSKYIQETINHTLPGLLQLAYFYDIFSNQRETGIDIPDWGDFILPHLQTVTYDFYKTFTGTKTLKQITSGLLLKKVVESFRLKINNQLDTKLFLYSGHDTNICAFLDMLDNMPKIQPPYCSHIAIEGHTINGVDGLKIFYSDQPDDDGVALNIPNCGLFCPLSNFTELYKGYFHEFETC